MRIEKMVEKKSRKAVSPVIATVLLIVVGVALAGTILIWSRGLIKEGLQKFQEPIENSCKKINLQLSISSGELRVINRGEIPVYKLGILTSGSGTDEIIYLSERNFNVGSSQVIQDDRINNVERIVPVLLGSDKDGAAQEFQCPEDYWLLAETE